jgi:hypothetical protein
MVHDAFEATDGVLEQRIWMMDEVRGRIEREGWGELEVMDEGYCRCEEQTKAWVTKHIR